MINIKSALIVTSIIVATFQASTGYKVETRYPVPGNGGFDYVTIDSAARRLYLSHGTQVDVVNPDNGQLIGTIPDTPGVHGIAIASEFKHGFTNNGRENKVSMFDPTTLQLISKIDVGKGPDGIYYDPGTKRVFTNNLFLDMCRSFRPLPLADISRLGDRRHHGMPEQKPVKKLLLFHTYKTFD